jgi:Ca2+-binding RTX toxin-like protein
LQGGPGNDLYVVNDAGDVVIEAADAGADQVNVAFVSAGTYVLPANVENGAVTAAATVAVNLTGNALDNILTGNAAANTLTGGAGDDTLDGGAGADKLIGGTGNDVYRVDNAADVVTETANGGIDRVETVLGAYTLGANVENLVYKGAAAFTGTGNLLGNALGGGVGNDKLLGLAGNDVLHGYAGNDSLDGGAGDDLLDAGTGSDTVDGGAGDDTLQVLGRYADYTRTRPSATDTVLLDKATGETILLRNVEHIAFADGVKSLIDVQANTASAGNDALTGTAGNDTLDGGLGSDTLAGGQGDDTYVVNDAGDVVIEQAGAGTDGVKVAFVKAGTYTLPDNVENATVTAPMAVAVNLTGNAIANSLTGNGAANVLLGGAGDDTLDGGAGADTLDGGAGLNTLTGGDGKDVFVLASAGADNRVLDFHTGTDKLRIGQAALHIGDGDALVEGAVLRAAAGGFAAGAELVIFTAKIAGALTTASAAAAIGSATHAYALGASALFVVNNGHDSALFRFEAHDQDAVVSSGELTELAVLVGTPGVALADVGFAL